MTFISSTDRARAAAPTSGLMKTPDYLEALVYKRRPQHNWMRDNVAEENRVIEARKNREMKRRKKLQAFEDACKRHNAVVALAPLKNGAFHTATIIEIYCDEIRTEKQMLLSKNNNRRLTLDRQILVWILRNETDLSLASIGEELGGRDHTTMCNSIKKINSDPALLEKASHAAKRVMMIKEDKYGR